jgi:hypothetical protein
MIRVLAKAIDENVPFGQGLTLSNSMRCCSRKLLKFYGIRMQTKISLVDWQEAMALTAELRTERLTNTRPKPNPNRLTRTGYPVEKKIERLHLLRQRGILCEAEYLVRLEELSALVEG